MGNIWLQNGATSAVGEDRQLPLTLSYSEHTQQSYPPFRRWLVRKDKADSHGSSMIISQGSGGTVRPMSPFD